MGGKMRHDVQAPGPAIPTPAVYAHCTAASSVIMHDRQSAPPGTKITVSVKNESPSHFGVGRA